MQTKFNIGDEVETHNQIGIIELIQIKRDSSVGYCLDCQLRNYIAESSITKLIRPKGCPFKVGDTVKTNEGYLLTVHQFINNGRTVINQSGMGAMISECTLVVTDECPKTSSQTHVDELRTVLDEICKVLKLPGSPSYLELPKIIGTRLEHLALAYAHCDELREILHLSNSSSIPMIVAAVKELRDLYNQSRKVANDNRRSYRRELNGIVQALNGGATSENVDMILLCNHRMQQIDELKKKLDKEQKRSAKIKSLFDFAK